jgi:glycosyltransferase involved in cell wall biosynthesis
VSLAVGLLHFTAPPVVGGVETVLGHHARLMAAAGWSVRMIAGRGGPPDPGVDLVTVPLADGRHPAIRDVQRALDLGSVPPAFEGVVDELARDLRAATDGLDVVVAHNVCSLSVNIPLTAALHRLVEAGDIRRLVAWNHDIAAASERYRPRLHAGRPWDLFRQPWPAILTVTISEPRRGELAAATGVPAGTVRVVPNGIDRDGFLGLSPSTHQLIHALHLGTASPVLLTPARVTPRKNLELAVGVAAELRRSGDDARLVITGSLDPHDADARRHLDALRELALRTGAADGVHLLVDGPPGWRSERVVADLFRVADVLFLPSHDEGFGLPILEAGVCRLPVVCSDIPALRELAGDDATYIDPAGTPAAAAARLRERLAGDPAFRLATRCRAAFDWDALFATRIRPLLLEAAAGPAGSAGPAMSTGSAGPV